MCVGFRGLTYDRPFGGAPTPATERLRLDPSRYRHLQPSRPNRHRSASHPLGRSARRAPPSGLQINLLPQRAHTAGRFHNCRPPKCPISVAFEIPPDPVTAVTGPAPRGGADDELERARRPVPHRAVWTTGATTGDRARASERRTAERDPAGSPSFASFPFLIRGSTTHSFVSGKDRSVPARGGIHAPALTRDRLPIRCAPPRPLGTRAESLRGLSAAGMGDTQPATWRARLPGAPGCAS